MLEEKLKNISLSAEARKHKAEIISALVIYIYIYLYVISQMTAIYICISL
jgi:hypothetical protein